MLAPYVSGKKGEYKKQMAEMVKEGFLRARVDGKMVDLDDPPELDKQKKHTIEIVVDRLVAKAADDDDYRKRLADSIETAARVSERARHPVGGGRAGGGPLGQLRVPGLRDVADRDHAPPLLLQLALRRLHRRARASART